MTQRKLKKWPQFTQFLAVFKRLGFFFKKRFTAHTAYAVFTYKDKLKNFPLNNLNKYLHYGTSETE